MFENGLHTWPVWRRCLSEFAPLLFQGKKAGPEQLILGSQRHDDADYLELCRRKRNTTEDDRTGAATEADAVELIAFTETLRADVLAWLQQHHPNLMPV